MRVEGRFQQEYMYVYIYKDICTYLSLVYSTTFTTQWCAGSNPEDNDPEDTSGWKKTTVRKCQNHYRHVLAGLKTQSISSEIRIHILHTLPKLIIAIKYPSRPLH